MSLVASLRDRSQREDGFTMSELVVYSLILALVLGTVGAIMISMQRVERDVRLSTGAATQAQFAADNIADGIRNSRSFDVVISGLAEEGDAMLMASTANRSSDVVWECSVWYYSALEHTIRSHTSGDTIPNPPSSSAILGWTLLAEDVNLSDSSDIFSRSGSQVLIQFETVVNDNTAAVITSSATSRAGEWVSSPCF